MGAYGHYLQGLAVMPKLEFLIQGRPATADEARQLVVHRASEDLWDLGDVLPIWSRLVDENEQYEERIDCSDTIFSICAGDLEMFVPEPSE